MSRHAWMDDAACLGMDVNLFFPDSGAHDDRAAAIRVCLGCPVKGECAEAGRGESGIWGGLSENQRTRKFHDGRIRTTARPIAAPRRDDGAIGAALYATEPIVGSQRRLQALARLGYGAKELAALIQDRGHHITHTGIAILRDGAQDFTTPERVEAVTAIYNELIHRGRHSTSSRADVNIAKAAAKGYAHPKDWVGLDIDDPATQPRAVQATS